MRTKNTPVNTLRRHQYSTGHPEWDRMIRELFESTISTANADLLREIAITAVRIGEDGMERGDVKMMNSALKELRYAFNVFYPYRHIRKVAIFGSARTPRTAPDYKLACRFAAQVVKEGWMVITGASSGIMNAGNEGAGRGKSFGVNIRLPFEQEANPVIANDAKLINFKYFFTRKLIFVRESDATVLFPGGFGTHDEGFETLTLIQTGKTTPRPVICMDPEGSGYWRDLRRFLERQLAGRHMIDRADLDLIHFTHSPEDAVRVITDFYRNYHSMRYIRDLLVIRVKRELAKKHLARLSREFRDIVKKGGFEQYLKPFPEEENEPHTYDLPRLAFYFNRRHFARLKQLIDGINQGD